MQPVRPTRLDDGQMEAVFASHLRALSCGLAGMLQAVGLPAEGAQLLLDLAKDPESSSARGVLADWLEDRGIDATALRGDE